MQDTENRPPELTVDTSDRTEGASPAEPPNVVGHTVSSSADAGSQVFADAWSAHTGRMAQHTANDRRKQSLRMAREVVETGILALVIFLSVRAVVQNFRVEGLSMDPTYSTGQYVLVNKALYSRLNLEQFARLIPGRASNDSVRYLFRSPSRGDVVVFEPPITNRGNRDFIKRIIGEPGDHVVVKDGKVTVNNLVLDERYIPGVLTTCGGQWCDVTLGPDEYFMMGDNRPNSSDSRLWGPVKGGSIVGKTWLIYLPFRDFGPAPNGAPVMTPANAASP